MISLSKEFYGLQSNFKDFLGIFWCIFRRVEENE